MKLRQKLHLILQPSLLLQVLLQVLKLSILLAQQEILQVHQQLQQNLLALQIPLQTSQLLLPLPQPPLLLLVLVTKQPLNLPLPRLPHLLPLPQITKANQVVKMFQIKLQPPKNNQQILPHQLLPPQSAASLLPNKLT